MKLLALDDNNEARRAVVNCYERGGHKVFEVQNENELKDFLKSRATIDVILLDHHLGRAWDKSGEKRWGYELIAELKERFGENTLIISHTSSRAEIMAEPEGEAFLAYKNAGIVIVDKFDFERIDELISDFNIA